MNKIQSISIAGYQKLSLSHVCIVIPVIQPRKLFTCTKITLVHILLHVHKYYAFDDWKYMKIIYVHCGEETDISDPRSYEHYERVVEIRPGKKIQAHTESRGLILLGNF